jgi:hypothetical protein
MTVEQMSDYLEFVVENEYVDYEEEILTVMVHTKDNRTLLFKDVKGMPVIYKNLFHITHMYLEHMEVNSQVPVSDFSHLSYYITARKKTNG